MNEYHLDLVEFYNLRCKTYSSNILYWLHLLLKFQYNFMKKIDFNRYLIRESFIIARERKFPMLWRQNQSDFFCKIFLESFRGYNLIISFLTIRY